jgi:hypothetical protein
MLKRSGSKITFVLPIDTGPVSVVGDFNGWDPAVHPLKKRSNGTRSVTVEIPPGRHRFRYLAEGAAFFDDADADMLEANGYGGTHSVLIVEGALPTEVVEATETPKRVRTLGRKKNTAAA